MGEMRYNKENTVSRTCLLYTSKMCIRDSRKPIGFRQWVVHKYNHGEEKHWNRADLIKTARHEAGHAVVCNYFGEEPSYLTVAARDNHGGYMMYSAAEGKGVYTKKELLRQIAVSLGGRAAELAYYGEEEGPVSYTHLL